MFFGVADLRSCFYCAPLLGVRSRVMTLKISGKTEMQPNTDSIMSVNFVRVIIRRIVRPLTRDGKL